MRTRTWLTPVIGVVAAIAVGAAATIAARAIVADPVEQHETTVLAPVLQPMAADAPLPDPSADAAMPDGGAASAPPLVEVPDPALAAPATDATPLSARDTAVLAEAAASDDPYFSLVDALPSLFAPLDDPCAVDSTGEGCPAGSTGVLRGGEVPPLAAAVERGSCAVASGTNLAVAVRTNAPADIVVTLRSGGVTLERSVSTDAADAADWSPGSPARVLTHCVAADGWPRGAVVDVEAVVTDVLGRTATVDRSLTVPMSAGAVRPDAQILGLSGNLVQVSVPFAAGQEVGIGWVDADAACAFSEPGGDSGAVVLHPRVTAPITAEYTADRNWLPAYDRRTTTTFLLGPGASYRVCVGWFDGGHGDISGRPQYRNEVVVHAPATSFPTVTIDEVRLDVDLADDGLRIRGAVPGALCGEWRGPGRPLPAPVCELSALAMHHEANGYITITTEVATDAGLATNHHVIEASAVNCEGGCAARTASFRLPLLSARPGMCSGSCPDQEVLGWARLTASWPDTVGRQWWEFGETVTGGFEELDGDHPNMDTVDAQWTLATGYNPVTGTQGAWFPLTTDRPVTVEASLSGDCFRTPEPAVYRNSELQQWHGGRIEFPELCMGTRYVATVVLTDEDGDVSVYGHSRGDGRLWAGADFRTQRVVMDLPLQVRLTAPEGEYWALASSQFSLGGDGGRVTGASTPAANVRRCFSTGGDIAYRLDDVTAGSGNRIELRLRVRQTAFGSDAVSPDGFRDCELLPEADYRTIEIVADLTLDQLLAGDIVDVTDPETGIAVRIRPEPTLFR